MKNFHNKELELEGYKLVGSDSLGNNGIKAAYLITYEL